MSTLTVPVPTKPRVRVTTNGRASALVPLGGSRAYVGASLQSQEIASWIPPGTSGRDEISTARDMLVRRSRDLVRNNGWAQTGVNRRTDSVIGTNLWFSSKPMYAALGQTPEWAATWGADVELKFRSWCNDLNHLNDVEMGLTFGAQMQLAYRHSIIEDEAIAIVYYLPKRGGKYGTAIRLVDPDLLCNPDGKPQTPTLRDGIELDEFGAATAYHFRKSHPNDSVVDPAELNRWTRVPRFTKTGRSNVIHFYRRQRAGQLRGVPRLAAVLKRFKMLEKYDETELQAAVLSAVVGLFITSDSPSGAEDAMAPVVEDDVDYGGGVGMSPDAARAEFHEKSNISFMGVRMPMLATNEKIQKVQAENASRNFAAFEAAVLRSIAGSIGITAEQLTGDYSGVNYSTLRGALNEIRREFAADFHLFTQHFATQIFAAWLEEAIILGEVKTPAGAPTFWDAKAAYCSGRWIGPPLGWVDPVKEADAAATRMAIGISDLERECADQGMDYSDVIATRARISAEMIAAGLPDPEATPAPGRAASYPSDPAPTDQKAAA